METVKEIRKVFKEILAKYPEVDKDWKNDIEE